MDDVDTSAVMPLAPRPAPVMARGSGSWLWDTRGTRYLDFVQGWAVNCLGHCPEVVTRALQAQAGQLINPSPAFHNPQQAQLAKALCARSGLDHAFFGSTGAEANEAAIKLARRWGSKHRPGAFEIITTHGSFHGRTLATMAASGKPGFDALFPPAIAGFIKVPYGDASAIEGAIGSQTVAVMVEPIQGEGGVVVPPAGYLRELRAISERHGVLLILDEVQTGIGRTGTLFAAEHESVLPDVMTLGKGLGGSIPLSAMLARKAVSCFDPGDQGGTFNGHALSCAIGSAVLEAITAEGFLDRVLQRGALLERHLNQIGSAYRAPRARGRGLLWALPLPVEKGREVVQAALRHGLLINSPQPSLLRLMPALNVSADEIDQAASMLSQALREVLG